MPTTNDPTRCKLIIFLNKYPTDKFMDKGHFKSFTVDTQSTVENRSLKSPFFSNKYCLFYFGNTHPLCS